MLEVRAQLRNYRMSPKKVRLVANTLKGLDASDALVRLRFTQKASSPVLIKLLKSAIANALHNNEIPAESLVIKKIVVNEGLPLKRWKPAAFGAAHPYKKRGSHVQLILGLKAGATAGAGKKKAASAKDKRSVKTVDISEVKRGSQPAAVHGGREQKGVGTPSTHAHRAAQQTRKSPSEK